MFYVYLFCWIISIKGKKKEGTVGFHSKIHVAQINSVCVSAEGGALAMACGTKIS